MNNPYKILNIHRNANREEIVKAKLEALRKKEYTPSEIQQAHRQLLNPVKRLVADFTFPGKMEAERLHFINVEGPEDKISFKSINEDAFDTLGD